MNLISSSFVVLFTLMSFSAFALDRQECRASKDQELIIQCINRKIYDPCEDSGGKWGAAQCGWAHAEIADRRIKEAEKQLITVIKSSKSHDESLKIFETSISAWNSYKDSHCRFTQAVDNLDNFSSMHLHFAFCLRRLNEQRASELEDVLSRSY